MGSRGHRLRYPFRTEDYSSTRSTAIERALPGDLLVYVMDAACMVMCMLECECLGEGIRAKGYIIKVS